MNTRTKPLIVILTTAPGSRSIGSSGHNAFPSSTALSVLATILLLLFLLPAGRYDVTSAPPGW